MEGGWKGREGGRDGGQKRTKRSNGTGKEERNRGVRYRRERKRERETGETGGRMWWWSEKDRKIWACQPKPSNPTYRCLIRYVRAEEAENGILYRFP